MRSHMVANPYGAHVGRERGKVPVRQGRNSIIEEVKRSLEEFRLF